MGAIGGLLGTAGGANGTGFSGPQLAQISSPVTQNQINTAYGGTQDSMASQQALLTALQGQNGLANQSQNYNQLQNVINGTGANPAQAQLAQSTGQNVANQAALMAGQRGAGANVGLMARQAAQQGANTQQQAAGQAATLQAQQSLNAIGQAGTMANTQAGQQIGQTNANTQAQQAEQANLLTAQGQYNNAAVSNQASVNNVNGQLANTNMQGQQGMIGGIMNGISSVMGSMGAEGGMVQSFDEGGDVDNGGGDEFTSQVQATAAPSNPTPTFGSDAGATALASGFEGGDHGGGGGGAAAAALAYGGDPSQATYQLGNLSTQRAPGVAVNNPATQPQSKFGKFLKGVGGGMGASTGGNSSTPTTGSGALQQGTSNLIGALGKSKKQNSTSVPISTSTMSGGAGDTTPNIPAPSDSTMDPNNDPTSMYGAKGGMVHAMVSPGEIYLTPEQVARVKSGENPLKVGEKIPGKPVVNGAKNSYANDVVSKDLKSGGIIIPRSETKSKNPARNSKDFVDKTVAKRGMKKR